jgi:broad specificity phosphatase PhoE
MDQDTTLLLVCPATADLTGRILTGRMAGVDLNRDGRAEARRLARRLHGIKLSAVLSGPLERAVQTAHAVASVQHLEVECVEALHEVDFGDWTGRTFSELERLPEWKQFVSRRSRHAPPHGEPIVAVQERIVSVMTRLAAQHRGAACALISHPEVLKAGIAHLLGLPLDQLGALDLWPASVSVVRAGESRGVIVTLNDVGVLERLASPSERLRA